MKHFIIAGVLVIVSTALISLLFLAVGLLPEQASTQAVTIDRLFNAHFFMIALLFSLIMVFMVYSIVVFRSKPGEKQEGAYFQGQHPPGGDLDGHPPDHRDGLFLFGARRTWLKSAKKPTAAMNVRVVGYQWAWLFEYPDYGINSTTLYLPVNKPGAAQHDLAGCDPFLLGAGVPRQAGCAARARTWSRSCASRPTRSAITR